MDTSGLTSRLEAILALIHEGIATEVKDELPHPFHLEYAAEELQSLIYDLDAEETARKYEEDGLTLPIVVPVP